MTTEEDTAFRKVVTRDTQDMEVISKVRNILNRAQKTKQWLECDCKKEDNQAILVPCLFRESQKFYFRALINDHNEHCHECVFNPARREWNPRSQWDKGRKARKPPDGFFAVLRESSEAYGLADQNTTQPSRNKARWSPRRPALSQLLLKVMESSELNKLSSANKFADRKNWDNDILKGITGIEIAPGKLLSELWFSDVSRWKDGTVQRKMTEAAKEWPDGHKPQGFLCWFVWDVDEDGVGLEEEEEENNRVVVINGVKQPLIHGEPVGKPYLFLGVVGLSANKKSGYQCIEAYAQPIVAKECPIPVDSRNERRALGTLKNNLTIIQKEFPIVSFSIEKPVFEIGTDYGPCLPDFMITACRDDEKQKFIIEVMGFDRPDYLMAKDVTHPRMEKLGTLITMDASKFRKPVEVKKEGVQVREKILEKLPKLWRRR